VFNFSRTFRGVNTDFCFNFSDIFLISPTSDLSDFLLNRAVRAVHVHLYIIITMLRNPMHSQTYINMEITHNIIMLSLQIRLYRRLFIT
jgi:hypothetical protein